MKTLSLSELRDALHRCGELTGEKDFVVVGSQVILASVPDASPLLRTSQDIDLFVKSGATAEVSKLIYSRYGPESEFDISHGFYIEPVGEWVVMTSLPGWQERLVKVDAPGGAIGWCLSPLDIAYNKAEAGREGHRVSRRAFPLRHREAFGDQVGDGRCGHFGGNCSVEPCASACCHPSLVGLMRVFVR